MKPFGLQEMLCCVLLVAKFLCAICLLAWMGGVSLCARVNARLLSLLFQGERILLVFVRLV